MQRLRSKRLGLIDGVSRHGRENQPEALQPLTVLGRLRVATAAPSNAISPMVRHMGTSAETEYIMSIIFTHEGRECLRKARALVTEAMRAENTFANRMAVVTPLIMTEEEYTEKEVRRATDLAHGVSEITTWIDALTGEH